MKISWLAAFVVVVPSVGCKKEAAKQDVPAPTVPAPTAPAPTAPAPTAPAPTAPAPAAPPTAAGDVKAATCPPDYKNPDSSFCITLPPGVTAGTPTKHEESGDVSFSDGTSVKWKPLERFDQEVGSLHDMATIHPNSKDIVSGDTPGGGKFTSWNWGDQYHVASVVKGPKWVFSCVVNNPAKDSPQLQTCKTLVAQ
jgi:hypothetical protein